MFSKASLLLLLASILVIFTSSHGAFCTYYSNSNSVTCGSVTCSTASPNSEADKLSTGYYYIGNYYIHGSTTPWFNLYRKRSSGGFWDYYTKIPELGCRGGFGLHSGGASEGCITVTDSSCFTQLRNEIDQNYRELNFNAYECRGCHEGWLWGYKCLWTQTIERVHTGDLESIQY